MERRDSIKRRNTGLFSRTLGQIPKSIMNANSTGINSKRRKIPLMFVPPSTQSPLFVYGNDVDQRSFLSLGTDLQAASEHRSAIERDNESIVTSRSLPSTLDHTNDDIDSVHQWLEEERERRSMHDAGSAFPNYGSANDTDDLLVQADRMFKDQESDLSYEEDMGFKDEEVEDFAHEKATTASESWKLAQYSFPLILTFVLEQIFSLVSVVFVGHLGKQELAAVSMASMTSTIILAIYEGIATALDTLCPQAYGAGQYAKVGIHTQRCSLFSLVLYIPSALFWWYSGSVLSHFIDDPEVVELSQQFLRILILGGPAYILFENGKRFLQAQEIFEAGTLILFITSPINILVNWVLIYYWDFGYIGAPIAAVLNFWLMFILLILYVVFIDGRECWDGFTWEALTHWYDLSLLAIPGTVTLLAESLAYEVLTLLASYFGTEALATQSALSSLVSLLYMVPFALSVASSTRLANFIGSGNIDAARVTTKVGLSASVVCASANSLLILFGSKLIARMFTEDPEVTRMIVGLCPLLSVFVLFDGLACVANGILRALALQAIGGFLSLLGYYVVAVPLAFVLAFHLDMELVGLWIGNGTGLLLIGVAELFVIYRVDWKKIVEAAKKRNQDK
ncbi:hypothetical protein OGAPHI_007019 [Ogataea philodendri]|uniref:MATE efflux family protein n=1 Tax=Ogataea philodendri TaxID=1378263 RepID=A0A9P8NV39_9ASCO|nr:uncharacterized protein OGAPHI_007019 [Ogataea philodendri]KAH3660433.1 hypothetical protein OGAPHI_007019 [Ogataea philodendri]